MLVDQRVPEGTCSQVLRSSSVGSCALKFSVFQIFDIVVLLVYYTIPFGFSFFWYFWALPFQLLILLCLVKYLFVLLLFSLFSGDEQCSAPQSRSAILGQIQLQSNVSLCCLCHCFDPYSLKQIFKWHLLKCSIYNAHPSATSIVSIALYKPMMSFKCKSQKGKGYNIT